MDMKMRKLNWLQNWPCDNPKDQVLKTLFVYYSEYSNATSMLLITPRSGMDGRTV